LSVLGHWNPSQSQVSVPKVLHPFGLFPFGNGWAQHHQDENVDVFTLIFHPFNPFNPFPLPNGSYVQHHHQTNQTSTFSRHHPLPKALFLVRPSNSSTRLTSFISFSSVSTPLKRVLTKRLIITVLVQKSSFLEFPWS